MNRTKFSCRVLRKVATSCLNVSSGTQSSLSTCSSLTATAPCQLPRYTVPKRPVPITSNSFSSSYGMSHSFIDKLFCRGHRESPCLLERSKESPRWQPPLSVEPDPDRDTQRELSPLCTLVVRSSLLCCLDGDCTDTWFGLDTTGFSSGKLNCCLVVGGWCGWCGWWGWWGW